MPSFNWVAVLIVCMTVGWIVTTWIRAKHGYSIEGTWGNEVPPPSSDSAKLVERLEAELAARDATIAKLEQRIRVLERIVTDGSAELRSRIDELSA